MFKKITTHKFVSIFSGISLFFVLAGIGWSYFALRSTQAPLIVHFDDLRGITQTGGFGTFLAVGIFGLVVACLNSVIALELESRTPFFGKFVAVLTLAFAVLLFIGFSAIIGVN
jgi:hypothetical protein